MAFCTKCGKQLNEGDHFCSNCGKPTEGFSKHESEERQERWEGAVFKCPRCGQTLDAYTERCPSCGYQLRQVEAVNSVKELAAKIEHAKDDKARVSLVKSFPIPNSREDIVEFLIMAVSNIDEDAQYGTEEENLTKAWVAKADQALQKAELVIPDDGACIRLRESYEKKLDALQRSKTWNDVGAVTENVGKGLKAFGKFIIAVLIFYLALFAILLIF